jgi:DNA-binding response OmpR family regulator
MSNIETLKQSELFKGLQDHELALVAATVVKYQLPTDVVLLTQHEPAPAVFILQSGSVKVMVNGERGIEFLKLVRADKRLGPVPFIMITAESERTLVMDAVKAGVSSYIMKPFTPAMLEAKMKTVWTKLHP